MAALEDLLGQMLGGHTSSTSASPVGSLFLALFQGVPGGMNSSGAGGLTGLVHQFEQAGFGDIVHSWIDSGPNRPVQPEQLRQVLGAERVSHYAALTGIPEDELLMQLAQLLPGLVERMTPDGHLP